MTQRIRINITLNKNLNEEVDKAVEQLKQIGTLKSVEGKSTIIEMLLYGFLKQHQKVMSKLNKEEK